MDLRNLSSTPTQLDSVMHRRPSLLSLSSASGYASSSYGGANTQGNNTPQLANLRLAGPSRGFAGLPNNSSLSNLQSSWLHQNQGATSALPQSLPQAPLVNNVAPWVEQQKQHHPVDIADSNSTLDDDDVDDVDDDELIPTAIVIKNIPFAIKKEQLLDVMTKLSLPLPYAFNYHFDNGVFRGLAFANFTSTDETSLVVNQLNGREIGGRKLRVEYKKMLPLQERERIEREKREKRGQLEEQHRSTSTASLASLLSTASTTAATKNLSVNGASSSQAERVFVQFPNLSAPLPPAELNFNDPDVLDLYSQLLVYRDDSSKSVFELAFPANLALTHRKLLSILCAHLGLLELYDNGLIIIRRKPGHQRPLMPLAPLVLQPHHSNSMMNLNQLSDLVAPQNQSQQPQQQQHQHQQPQQQQPQNSQQPPELLRSHSQSALPLPRLRQQASTPVQQHFPPYQLQHQSQSLLGRNYHQGQQFGLYHQAPAAPSNQGQPQGSSAAALLRSSNNRSYVDVRSTPPFAHQQASDSPTPQNNQHGQHPFFNNNPSSSQLSQPLTPLGNTDLNSRFAPFGQHTHLNGSFTSLQHQGDEYSGNEVLPGKFNGLNLGASGYENPQSTSGIWGPK